MHNLEPIRIIQYIGSLNSGGSQSMIMNIYRKIDKKKFQFDFVVDRADELLYKEEIETLGGKVFIFDEYFKGKNYFSFIKQWNEFFKNHKDYKIIHCHVRSVASIVLRIAKKYGIVTICHSHSTSNGKGLSSLIKNQFQKKIVKYADYQLACSKEAAIWLYGNNCLDNSNCMVLQNGIDSNKFKYNKIFRDEIRNKYSIEDDEVLIGHVGRFEEVKNHRFIIDCAYNILKKNNNYIFMFCGDGTLKENIKLEIENGCYKNNFIFIDTTNEIYKYYNAFDMFVLPSKYEGLGMVLIEAQYSGLKCIISPNIPKEAIISNNVKKIDLDVNEWVKEILSSKVSDSRKNDLTDKAKEYDISFTCSKLCNIYDKASRGDIYEKKH